MYTGKKPAAGRRTPAVAILVLLLLPTLTTQTANAQDATFAIILDAQSVTSNHRGRTANTDWVEHAGATSGADAVYAYTSQQQRDLVITAFEAPTSDASIQSARLRFLQEIVGWRDDAFQVTLTAGPGCATPAKSEWSGTPTATTISVPITCADATPTWADIAGLQASIRSVNNGGLDVEWRIHHAYLEIVVTNAAPRLAVSPPQTAPEASPVQLTASADDPEGDAVAIQWIQTQGPGVALTQDGLGTADFTAPDLDRNEDALLTFQAQATDARGATSTATTTVTITNVNQAPTATDDAFGLDEDTLLQVAAPGLLANDGDADQDALTAILVAGPQNGTLVLAPDGGFQYTPDTDRAGPDSFTYRSHDGRTPSEPAHVALDVRPINDAPVLDPIPDGRVAEDQTLTVRITASDVDGDPLTFTAPGLPDGAHLDADGTLTWRPTFSQSGSHDLTVEAHDATAFDAATFTVVVDNTNRAPRLDPITPPAAREGQTLHLNATAIDPDDDPIAFEVTDAPAGADFDPAQGRLTWTPTFTQAGDHRITLLVRDAYGLFDSANVTLHVDNTNRPPVLAPIDDVAATEDEPVAFTVNATDPDGPADLTAADLPTGATFDAALGHFAWTPSFDQAGLHAVTFFATDGEATTNHTVRITVGNTNRAPTLTPIPDQTIAEAAELAFPVQAHDADGDEILLLVRDAPPGATLDLQTATFRWTPDYDQAGEHRLTLDATDGELTATIHVTLHVTDTNRAPTLDPLPDQTAAEGQPLSFQLAASDPDGPVTLTLGPLPDGASFDADSGAFTWTPDHEQAGTYDLVANATDGTATVSQDIRIVVADTNRAPVFAPVDAPATDENTLLDLTISAADADGDDVTLAATLLPDGASFRADTGVLLWTPRFDQAGEHEARFSATDGQATTLLSVALRVEDAPAATHLAFSAVPEQATSGRTFALTVDIVNETGAKAAYAERTVTLSLQTAPTGGVLQGNLSRLATNGTVTFEDLTLDRAGDYVLNAAAIGLAATDTDPIHVTHGDAHHLAFTQVPSVVATNAPFTLRAEVRDASDNVVQASDATATLEADAEGTLSGPTSATAIDGVLEWSDLRLGGADAVRLTAAAPGLASAHSQPVSVTPAASRLVLDAAPTTAVSLRPFVLDVRVAETDGRTVGEAEGRVRIQLVSGPAGGRLLGVTDRPLDGGRASFSDLRLDRAGDYQLRATSDGLDAILAPTLTITPGAANRIEFTSAPTRVVSGVPFAVGLRILDLAGNLVPASRVVSLGKALGAGALEGPASVTTHDGVATANGLVLRGTGTYSIAAASPGLTSALSGRILVDSAEGTDAARRIEVTPASGLVLEAGASYTLHATAYDEGDAPILDVAFEWEVEPAGTATVDANGLVMGHRTGDATVRARIGPLASNAVPVRVVAGALAQLRIVPEAAAMDAGVPIDFLAQGFDARGNPVPIGGVDWSVDGVPVGGTLGPFTTFQFPAGATEGPHTVTATTGDVQRKANVHVTSTVAPRGAITVPPVQTMPTTLDGVNATAFSIGVGSAEADAVLALQPDDAVGLDRASVSLERPAQNLAIVVEIQDAGDRAPPQETDAANLTDLLDRLAAGGTPGLFVRVLATEGGQPLASAALNDLLGRMELDLELAASYFDDNGYDAARIRLIEYSDGRLVTHELFADRIATSADGRTHTFRVHIEEFSVFAVLGAAFSQPVVSAPMDAGGARRTGDEPIVVPRTTQIRTSDPHVPRVEFIRPESAEPSWGALRVRVFTEPAPAMPPLPRGVDVHRFLELHVDGPSVNRAIVHLRLPSGEAADGDSWVLLHLIDQAWTVEGPIPLQRSADTYEGSIETSCCSYFAIVDDLQAPTIGAAVPSGVSTGLVRLTATASDNLGLHRVEYYVDGQLVFTDHAEPFEYLLNTARFPNGTHDVQIVAWDAAGNHADVHSTIYVRNLRSEALILYEAPSARPPTIELPLGVLAGSLLFALLIFAGVLAAILRVRRQSLATPPAASPSPRPAATAGRANDNPLVPEDWF